MEALGSEIALEKLRGEVRGEAGIGDVRIQAAPDGDRITKPDMSTVYTGWNRGVLRYLLKNKNSISE